MGTVQDLENRLERIEDTVNRIDHAMRGDGNGSPGYSVRLDRVERALAEIKEAQKLRRSKQFTIWHGLLLIVIAKVVEIIGTFVF